jgi:Protein of unknown function (DUF4231)
MAADTISASPAVETRDPRETAAALDPATAGDPIFGRLEEEIQWYSRKSARCQRLYKWLKFVEIVAAAAIPLLAGFDTRVEVLAVLGALIVVLEGLQHVNQYQSNWITYRSTAEALKHEKFLYLAGAGPYEVEHPHSLLAERIESLISQEHAKWISERKEPTKAREQDA